MPYPFWRTQICAPVPYVVPIAFKLPSEHDNEMMKSKQGFRDRVEIQIETSFETKYVSEWHQVSRALLKVHVIPLILASKTRFFYNSWNDPSWISVAHYNSKLKCYTNQHQWFTLPRHLKRPLHHHDAPFLKYIKQVILLEEPTFALELQQSAIPQHRAFFYYFLVSQCKTDENFAAKRILSCIHKV